MRTPGRTDDTGAVAIVVVLFMLIILTMAAFVIDFGSVYTKQAQLQNAADAGALAAARDLPVSGSCITAPTSLACVRGRAYAEANGVASGQATVVTPVSGDSSAVEVTVRGRAPFFFGRLLGIDGRDVEARAVAIRTGGATSGFAIYAGNQANINGGGSATAAITGSIFGGGSGGGTCNSNCPLDIPNGVGKVTVTSGNAYSPVTPGMKANADLVVDGVVTHTSLVDTSTPTDPVTYATQIGLLGVINGYLASGPTVAAPVASGRCAINLSNRTLYPVGTKVITCSTRAVLTGTADPGLKLIRSTGRMDIDTNVGSAGNVVILATQASGGSAVMPTKGVTVYGTIYAPMGEVRTNGQSFAIRQGRIVARDFLQNGNGGGFTADVTGDPYAVTKIRLSQ